MEYITDDCMKVIAALVSNDESVNSQLDNKRTKDKMMNDISQRIAGGQQGT